VSKQERQESSSQPGAFQGARTRLGLGLGKRITSEQDVARGNTARIAASSSALGLDLDVPFTTTCRISRSQIKAIALIDTGATGGNFINAVDAQRICELEDFSPVELLKPRPIQGFDGTAAPPITHAIYPRLQVKKHVEDLCPLFITRLGNHSLILGTAWMKQHGVVLDLITDTISLQEDIARTLVPLLFQSLKTYKRNHHLLRKIRLPQEIILLP
jgi:hypothetical protein